MFFVNDVLTGGLEGEPGPGRAFDVLQRSLLLLARGLGSCRIARLRLKSSARLTTKNRGSCPASIQILNS